MKPRRCKHDNKWFVPEVKTKRYCSIECKNAAAQKRLRERAKKMTRQESLSVQDALLQS